MALKGTELIEKKNVLNELRSNNMTLQELRFFSIYLSKINARDKSTRVVSFPLSDFQRIMEFGRLNIHQLQSSTNRLLGKVVNIPDEHGGYTGFTLFKRCKVFKDAYEEWYVEIDASDDALPLLFDFKKNYFTYELWNALRLKSANQVRMYEILKQYENIGKREILTSELRNLLGIFPNEYARWDRFKIRVLDSCQKSLKENTDICFEYERGKVGNGGKWVTIIFYIHKNTEFVDQLTLDKFIDLQPTQELVKVEADDDEIKEGQYKNKNLGFLAGACNYEFSEKEMLVLYDLVKQIEPSSKGTHQFDYIVKKYHELNLQSEKRRISNRFGYLKKLIEVDLLIQ